MARKCDVCIFSLHNIHTDCFALREDGKCFALHDTQFGVAKQCPFYKKSNSVDPMVAKTIKKLNADIARRRQRNVG